MRTTKVGTPGDPAAAEAAATEATPAEAARGGAVALGVLVAPAAGGAWRVRVGAAERVARVDASVDPALLEEAAAQGARALLDVSGEATVVGVVLTARPVALGRDGGLTVRAGRVLLDAAEVLVKTPHAFLRVGQGEVELAGVKVLTRAREVAKILARVIALN